MMFLILDIDSVILVGVVSCSIGFHRRCSTVLICYLQLLSIVVIYLVQTCSHHLTSLVLCLALSGSRVST